jgi:uncharacterized protein
MAAGKDALAYPPRVTAFTRPFYDALAEGRLTTTRCRDCGRMTFPPKFACPHCWSREVGWESLAGTGTLRTFTEVWAAPGAFAAETPYLLGIVDLDEGLRCVARIDGSYDDHVPDERVEMVVRHAEPVPLFAFRRPGGNR